MDINNIRTIVRKPFYYAIDETNISVWYQKEHTEEVKLLAIFNKNDLVPIIQGLRESAFFAIPFEEVKEIL